MPFGFGHLRWTTLTGAGGQCLFGSWTLTVQASVPLHTNCSTSRVSSSELAVALISTDALAVSLSERTEYPSRPTSRQPRRPIQRATPTASATRPISSTLYAEAAPRS